MPDVMRRPLRQQLSASLGWRIRQVAFRIRCPCDDIAAAPLQPFPLFFTLMPLQPLLGGLLHQVRGSPVQVECHLLDGPNDVRIHGCQELSLLALWGFRPLLGDGLSSAIALPLRDAILGTSHGLLLAARYRIKSLVRFPDNLADISFLKRRIRSSNHLHSE